MSDFTRVAQVPELKKFGVRKAYTCTRFKNFLDYTKNVNVMSVALLDSQARVLDGLVSVDG